MKERRAPSLRKPRTIDRRTMLTSMALGCTSLSALSACSNSAATSTPASGTNATSTSIRPPDHPAWKFVFVNHVTINPFFLPTRYGAEDACALVGCTYEWTGSQANKVSEMVDAIHAAIDAHVDGIAVSLIDPFAFNTAVDAALKAGIPVVSYNADVPANSPNGRLAYIGQDVYGVGLKVGQRIVDLVPAGEVVGFIATPGSLNLQPRIDGIRDAIKSSGKPINFVEISTGASIGEELASVEAYYQAHPKVKGMFAVDAGSTQGLGQVMEKYNLAAKGVRGGGYALTPITLSAINKGYLDFTVDQQPYMQGFLPIIQLYLYKLSGGLQQPSSTNTGQIFVTKDNIGPYLKTQTRFEGSSNKEKSVGH